MFWDDINLVTDQIVKYGKRSPMVDLGGMAHPCIADYELTIRNGDQMARYIRLNQHPFDHIDPSYEILNPADGEQMIEDLPYSRWEAFGAAVCFNVLEHVQNRFRIFAALYQIMRHDSLLVLSTVFNFPYHPSPDDYWSFSPDCLLHLASTAGFTILECTWRLNIPAEMGIHDIHTNRPKYIYNDGEGKFRRPSRRRLSASGAVRQFRHAMLNRKRHFCEGR